MNQLLIQTIHIVQEAGKAVMDLYGKDIHVRNKDDSSPVSDADIIANTILTNGFNAFGWPILSEETEDDLRRLDAERICIIDPLDGTKDFIEQTGEFSIMVGLVERGQPILGVVAIPADGTVYFAHKNGGAFVRDSHGNDKQIHVSSTSDLRSAKLIVTRSHYSQEIEDYAHSLGISTITKMGSNGPKVGYVAMGKQDITYNPTPKTGEWDICGPHIILEEAGGTITGMDGSQLQYNKKDPHNPKGYLATNGILHRLIIEKNQKPQ